VNPATAPAAIPAGTGDAPNVVISLEHVWLYFGQPVLRDVSLDIRQSETMLIVGESGSGKTTILKLILRLLIPDRGTVLVHGRDITKLRFAEALRVRQSMGMVFQGSALFDSLTVYENVAYPLVEHRRMKEAEVESIVRQKLQIVDLDIDEVGERLPSELSGGMKKRVGIARALANEPDIMLYDEPTAGLDPITTGTIVRLITKLQRELGVTSVVVSHDLRATLPIASRVAVLADQRIHFLGTPAEMLAAHDPYIQEFLGA
jgi:phospholipid/cholesterol/gamma-HCH transport system ATP-binding protein